MQFLKVAPDKYTQKQNLIKTTNAERTVYDSW